MISLKQFWQKTFVKATDVSANAGLLVKFSWCFESTELTDYIFMKTTYWIYFINLVQKKKSKYVVT